MRDSTTPRGNARGRDAGVDRRYWPVVGLAAAVWVALTVWVLPAVVRAVYDGRSIGWLNGIITGQDVNPVERYLAAANRLAWILWVALLAGAALVYVWRRWVGPSRTWLRLRGSESERAPLPLLVSVAVVIGAGVGWLEFGTLRARMSWWGFPGWYYSEFAAWMTPLAYVIAFVVLVLVLRPITWWWPRIGSVRTFVVLLGGIGVYALARAHLGMLHPAASAVLASGIAVRLSRIGTGWARRRFGVIHIAAAGAIVAVAALGVGQQLRHMVGEQAARGNIRAPSSAQPNILILILDTVRASSLSAYGYERPTSPNLERLARDGVTFDRAIATAPWTLPSTASMFTGRYHYELSANWESPLDDAHPTLAEILRAHGYATAGFFANPYFGSRFFGLDRGFGHWENHAVSPRTVLQNAWLTRSVAASLWKRIGHRQLFVRRTAADMNGAFLEWLDSERGARPFYAVINYFDAHAPFRPPEPFRGMFSAPAAQYWYWSGPTKYSELALQQLRDTYDDAIAYVDHRVGLLVDSLRMMRLLDSTLVVVVGDHGEEFGGHGVVGHGSSVFTPVVRVPLMLRYPPGAPRGVRIGTRVSVRNVAATALDIAGLPTHVPGSSLRDIWDRTPGQGETPLVLSEVFQAPGKFPDRYPVAHGSLRSILRGRWHYVRDADGHESLYDVEADPLELVDRSPERLAVLARFRAVMDSLQRLPVAVPPGDDEPAAHGRGG